MHYWECATEKSNRTHSALTAREPFRRDLRQVCVQKSLVLPQQVHWLGRMNRTSPSVKIIRKPRTKDGIATG